jgi:hypothetical protein
MFHPVGNEPPSVYWRRRLLLFASAALVILLIVLTARAMSSSAAGKPQGAGSHPPAPTTPASVRETTSSAAASSKSPASRAASHSRHERATESKHSTSVSNSASSAASSSVAPARCQPKDLDIRAVVARSFYKVGQRPEVELQVTNTGAQPCVQDLADKQIVLKIYNGESRVWGSHDCQIEPGTDDRVLAVDSPVRVSITWSGLTSRPNCAGTRQRVGAGTYTLYAALSGHTGKAAQFSIS